MEQRVVVESFADYIHGPDQAVVAFGHAPIVLQLEAAAAETDRVQGPVERYAAIVHRDINVVSVGLKLDPQIGRGEWEVGGDVRELVVSILTFLVASLHIPLSIAVPITALVLKKQLTAFCPRKPRKRRRTMLEIIDERRQGEKKTRKV